MKKASIRAATAVLSKGSIRLALRALEGFNDIDPRPWRPSESRRGLGYKT